MKFYTHFTRKGNFVLERGYDNGKRYAKRVEYCPTLYVPAQKHTGFKTLSGMDALPIQMDNMRSAKEFLEKYDGVDNFPVYGSTNYAYVYINEQFPEQVEYDPTALCVVNLDIEVGSENGFPLPEKASEPITAISLKAKNVFHVLGCGDFSTEREDVIYYKCKDEHSLIQKFLEIWEKIDADIVTGWNIQFFDIPYLFNRINRLMGENSAKRLSPYRMVGERTTTIHNRQQIAFDLVGISILDYLELYKKFTYSQQESFRLDHIAHVELGEKKLDYSEYENLHQLYRLDYQKFILYNIKDVELVEKIDDKMKLIDMVLALAYDAKVNLTDVFTQVRMWDTLTHNHLIKKNIVVPQKKHHTKSEKYEGAYVKDPVPGKYNWICSFDLNSLYPHLIMQYNVSPDTFVENKHTSVTIDQLLSESYSVDKDHCMAANGHYFRRDKQGFLAEMMETMYNDRSKYKKLMIEWQKKKESAKSKNEKIECEKNISKYSNLQLAKKVQLNSAYGALGSEHFRFFDIRQAEAITLSGQLSIRWIEKKLNQFMNKILKTKDVDYVIASDTDSIYLHMGPLVDAVFKGKNVETSKLVDFLDKACEEKIQPFIDKSYQELADYMNAYAQKMYMKREAISDTGIWTAKKRYILNVWNNEGVAYNEPKLKMMGIEAVKSSTPMSCREKIKEALKVVMRGDENEFHEFNRNFEKEFKSLPFEDVAFPRGVSEITKYTDKSNSSSLYVKGTPIHVRASLVYNNLLKKHKLEKKYQSIRDGDKIKFCYMKMPNPIQENVISVLNVLPKEFALEKYIDYDLQFEKAYLEPLNIIVNTFGWNTKPISSLMGFFE